MQKSAVNKMLRKNQQRRILRPAKQPSKVTMASARTYYRLVVNRYYYLLANVVYD